MGERGGNHGERVHDGGKKEGQVGRRIGEEGHFDGGERDLGYV